MVRPEELPKYAGGSGKAGLGASSSSGANSAKKCSIGSGTEFRATLTIPSESATSKTPESTGTHLKNSEYLPSQLNLISLQSLKLISLVVRRESEVRRCPMTMPDGHYCKMTYGGSIASRSFKGSSRCLGIVNHVLLEIITDKLEQLASADQ